MRPKRRLNKAGAATAAGAACLSTLMGFHRRGAVLYAEQVPVADIAARHGTPCFIYSRAALEAGYRAYTQALADRPGLVCYAVKANSNLAVLDVLARLGCGFDIVSGGELARVIAAGGDPGKVIFSGLGKTQAEIRQALQAGIYCFNVESAAELQRIASIAADLGTQAPVSLRVNPDVDAGTHPYISTGLKENKFGIPLAEAEALYGQAAQTASLCLMGVACHIGSQLTNIAPYLAALESVLGLLQNLAHDGIRLGIACGKSGEGDSARGHLDIGGGLGVAYGNEQPPSPADLLSALAPRLDECEAASGLRLILEPGRSIAGDAGIFVTRVEYLKRNGDKHFAVVDGAMNDLLRPALYQAWQDIVPVVLRESAQKLSHKKGPPPPTYDIVGPVCESADFLGKDRPLHIAPGDLLAVCTAGAYGFSMSSNYNSRPRAAEVMVDGGQMHLVRPREHTADLFAAETRLPHRHTAQQ